MIKKAVRYITHWEDWHWLAKYILIAPAWFWFCLKARSFWFFTPSNPTIQFGGFIGETKQEIYRQLPPSTYPRSIFVSPTLSFKKLHSLVENEFTFPVAVKPDAGMMGLMFRKIESIEHLRQYHSAMPADYIIQDWVTYPIEVSVFYYRYPGEQKGHITGFLRKECLQVTGDGKSNLRELIRSYPRVQFRLAEMFLKHQSKLDTIIPAGQPYQLSDALNLSRGGRLVSLEHEKDERLLKVFDDLSHHAGNFFYGRYDIRCTSVEDLKEGKNFSILEYNGCGAEPHHVYNNGNNLFQACSILVAHWNILYKISITNSRKGIAPWSYRNGLLFMRKATAHFKKLKEIDCSFELNPTTTAATLNRFSDSAAPDYLLASNG